MKSITPIQIHQNEFNVREHEKDGLVWYVLFCGHARIGDIKEDSLVNISDDESVIEFESPTGRETFMMVWSSWGM